MDWKSFKESLFASFLCTFGDLVSGFVLSGFLSKKFSILPALIILLPPSADMRGNVYGAFGSRLGTYLHMGRIEAKLKVDPVIAENIHASLFLVVTFSVLNGVVCSYLGYLLGLNPLSPDIILSLTVVSVLSSMLSALFMIPSTILIAILSYRFGWDPDNVTSPLITLAGDIVTVPLIYLSVLLVERMGSLTKAIVLSFVVLLGVLLFLKSNKSFVARRIMKEMLLILSICVLIDYGAGTILGGSLEGLIAIAGILTIIPPFLEDGGVIGCILAARVSSWLHLGEIEPTFVPGKRIREMFLQNHILGIVVFTMVALLGQTINVTMNIPTVSTAIMLAVTVLAGQLLVLILNFISYELVTLSYRIGLDPDNVGIPIITSLMDLMGTGTLVLMLAVFGLV